MYGKNGQKVYGIVCTMYGILKMYGNVWQCMAKIESVMLFYKMYGNVCTMYGKTEMYGNVRTMYGKNRAWLL